MYSIPAFLPAHLPPVPGVLPPSSNFRSEYMPVQHLRFTHDKIRPLFRSGPHSGKPLYELVNDLLTGKVDPTCSLEPLIVTWHNGSWRSLSNRRLWCLKAYMGLRGLCHLLVRVQIRTRLPADFAAKNSTKSNGCLVQVTGDEDALREMFKEARRPCRYFSAGQICARGDSCPFDHSIPDTRDTGQAAEDTGQAAEDTQKELSSHDAPKPEGLLQSAINGLAHLMNLDSSQEGKQDGKVAEVEVPSVECQKPALAASLPFIDDQLLESQAAPLQVMEDAQSESQESGSSKLGTDWPAFPCRRFKVAEAQLEEGEAEVPPLEPTEAAKAAPRHLVKEGTLKNQDSGSSEPGTARPAFPCRQSELAAEHVVSEKTAEEKRAKKRVKKRSSDVPSIGVAVTAVTAPHHEGSSSEDDWPVLHQPTSSALAGESEKNCLPKENTSEGLDSCPEIVSKIGSSVGKAKSLSPEKKRCFAEAARVVVGGTIWPAAKTSKDGSKRCLHKVTDKSARESLKSRSLDVREHEARKVEESRKVENAEDSLLNPVGKEPDVLLSEAQGSDDIEDEPDVSSEAQGSDDAEDAGLACHQLPVQLTSSGSEARASTCCSVKDVEVEDEPSESPAMVEDTGSELSEKDVGVEDEHTEDEAVEDEGAEDEEEGIEEGGEDEGAEEEELSEKDVAVEDEPPTAGADRRGPVQGGWATVRSGRSIVVNHESDVFKEMPFGDDVGNLCEQMPVFVCSKSTVVVGAHQDLSDEQWEITGNVASGELKIVEHQSLPFTVKSSEMSTGEDAEELTEDPQKTWRIPQKKNPQKERKCESKRDKQAKQRSARSGGSEVRKVNPVKVKACNVDTAPAKVDTLDTVPEVLEEDKDSSARLRTQSRVPSTVTGTLLAPARHLRKKVLRCTASCRKKKGRHKWKWPALATLLLLLFIGLRASLVDPEKLEKLQNEQLEKLQNKTAEDQVGNPNQALTNRTLPLYQEAQRRPEDAKRVGNVLKLVIYLAAGFNLFYMMVSAGGYSLQLGTQPGASESDLLDIVLVPTFVLCMFVFWRFQEGLVPLCGALLFVPFCVWCIVEQHIILIEHWWRSSNIVVFLLTFPCWALYPIKFYLYLLSWSSHWLGFSSSTVCLWPSFWPAVPEMAFIWSVTLPDGLLQFIFAAIYEHASEFTISKLSLTLVLTVAGYLKDPVAVGMPKRLVSAYSKAVILSWVVPVACTIAVSMFQSMLVVCKEIVSLPLQQMAITLELCEDEEGALQHDILCEETRADTVLLLLSLSLGTHMEVCLEAACWAIGTFFSVRPNPYFLDRGYFDRVNFDRF